MDAVELTRMIIPCVLALGLAFIGHLRMQAILKSRVVVLEQKVEYLSAEVIRCRGDRNYLEELLDQQVRMDSVTFNDKLKKVQDGLAAQGLPLTVREIAILQREHERSRSAESA